MPALVSYKPFDSAAGLLLDDGCLVIQPKVMRQTSALLQEKMNYSSLAGWTHQNRADTELLVEIGFANDTSERRGCMGNVV